MYTVILQPAAEEEIEEAHVFIKQQSPLNAARWFNGLVDALITLEHSPERCALAPENDVFEPEIRQLIHSSFRVLFTVREETVHTGGQPRRRSTP